MTLGSPLRRIATRLMAKFGTAATVRKIIPGIYNAETGTVSRTTSDTSVQGIFEDVNLSQVSDLIRSTDRRFTFSAADIAAAPTTADRLVYGGAELEIVQVKTVEQDGLNIVHELIVRG